MYQLVSNQSPMTTGRGQNEETACPTDTCNAFSSMQRWYILLYKIRGYSKRWGQKHQATCDFRDHGQFSSRAWRSTNHVVPGSLQANINWLGFKYTGLMDYKWKPSTPILFSHSSNSTISVFQFSITLYLVQMGIWFLYTTNEVVLVSNTLK